MAKCLAVKEIVCNFASLFCADRAKNRAKCLKTWAIKWSSGQGSKLKNFCQIN